MNKVACIEPVEALRKLTGILKFTVNGRYAIEREDFLFTGPIIQSTVLNMVQVIFALN